MSLSNGWSAPYYSPLIEAFDSSGSRLHMIGSYCVRIVHEAQSRLLCSRIALHGLFKERLSPPGPELDGGSLFLRRRQWRAGERGSQLSVISDQGKAKRHRAMMTGQELPYASIETFSRRLFVIPKAGAPTEKHEGRSSEWYERGPEPTSAGQCRLATGRRPSRTKI